MPGQVSPLGQRVDARRIELGLRLRDVAAAAGLSIEVLRAIRYGENEPRGLTLGKLDRALRWEPGSAARFLADGTEPEPLDELAAQDSEAAAIVEAIRRLYPGDTVILAAAEAIMAQAHKSLEVRRSELDTVRAAWDSALREQRALGP